MFSHLTLERPLAFVDLETTGVDPQKDRIIEISVLKFTPPDKRVLRTRRLNPGMAIPADATAVHGITDADVEGEANFGDIAPQLLKFLDGCDLCGYNLKRFDLRMLYAEFERAGLVLHLDGRSIIDPMQIFHHYERRDLAAAVRFYLGREHENSHAAEADVQATAKVLAAMLDRYDDLPRSVRDLHDRFGDPGAVDLGERFSRTEGEIRFRFGKYRGQPLDAVAQSNPDYLEWMLSQDFGSDTKKVVAKALEKVGRCGARKGLAYGSLNNGLAAYFTTDTGQIWVRNNWGKTFALVQMPSTADGWVAGTHANKIVMDPDDYHYAYVLESTTADPNDNTSNKVWQVQLIDNGQPTTNGETVPAVWHDLTDNLSTVANIDGTINLQALEAYDPTPGGGLPGDAIPLVGGLGGVYQRLPTGSGGFFWSSYGGQQNGASVPNVVVTDLHYIPPNLTDPSKGDILLAGTLGRGAWIVPQASSTLGLANLEIFADPGGPNVIRLVLDSANATPAFVDVFQNNTTAIPNFRIPESWITAIQVISLGTQTTLVVDESNGVIGNTVLFSGGSGKDLLITADEQDAVAENVTLGTDQISGLGTGIFYNNVNFVQLVGGTAQSTYTVSTSDPTVTMALDTGPAGNAVFVQQTAGSVNILCGGSDNVDVHDANGVQDIQGLLTVNGLRDLPTLVLDDTEDVSSQSFTVTDTEVTKLAPGVIKYNLLGNLEIATGQGNNAVKVLNTALPLREFGKIVAETLTQIKPGFGHGSLVATVLGTQSQLILDRAFFVGVGNGTLQNILGKITVSTSLRPIVVLYVDDHADPIAEQAHLGRGQSFNYQITGLVPVPIIFGKGVGLTVEGFGPGGTFTVDDTLPGSETAINSTGTVNVLGTTGDLGVQGGTVINVGGTGNGLDHIQGPIAVNGEGKATLNYLDQGATPGRNLTYTISASQMSRAGTATVSYSGMPAVNIDAANAGSTGTNTLFIATTAPGTTYNVNAGTGVFNEFALSNNSNLDGMQGSLNLHGLPGPGNNDFAIVSDFLNLGVHTYTLTTGEMQRDGISPLFYDHLTLWEVFIGQGADTVNILSAGAGMSTVVAANDTNTVTVGTPTGNGQHTLQNILSTLLVVARTSMSGQGASILLDDSGNTSSAARTVTFANDPFGYRIHNLAPGDLYLRPGNGSLVTVAGDGGNETFAFQDLPANMQMTLDGGGGTNTLDYSQFVGDVTVNLPLGVATGLAGITNIQNVTGSQGNDLIVGDANANVLIGGTGRNVIIGGAGADTLDASGASSDNILIGGTTDFDTNPPALDAIFAEWTRTDLPPQSSFRIRFDDLISGSSGALNIVNNQLILLTPTTVHADSSPDTLIGTNNIDPSTGQRAHNWFFFDFDDVLVNFLSSRDHKTKVK